MISSLLNQGQSDPKRNDNEQLSNAMMQYHCVFRINDVEVLSQNIVTLEIREWALENVPRLELMLQDYGIFTNRFPLQDNDVITVEIGINEEEEFISMEFLLNDFEIDFTYANDMRPSIIHLTGYLKTKNLLAPIYNKSYAKMTSVEALKSIAESMELNVDVRKKSNDVMNWLQINQNNNEMLGAIKERSYLSDGDVILACGTRNGDYIVSSMRQELTNDVKIKATYDIHKFQTVESLQQAKEESVGNGTLSSLFDDEEDSSVINVYFNDYRIFNATGTSNKNGAYGSSVTYYDLNEQQNEIIDVDYHPLTTNSFKDKNKLGSISLAKVYDYQTSNTHNKYTSSLLRNHYFLNTLFSAYLMITIRPDMNVNLLDKIDVTIPQQDDVSQPDPVHSGEYLIGAIDHQIAKDGIYTMTLILVRNGTNVASALQDEFETRLS